MGDDDRFVPMWLHVDAIWGQALPKKRGGLCPPRDKVL